MDLTPYLPYAVPALILSWPSPSWPRCAGDLSAQSEGKQASRVQRIEGAVSRVAGGIASDLLQAKIDRRARGHRRTRSSRLAVAQGAQYLLTTMPDTIKARGSHRVTA